MAITRKKSLQAQLRLFELLRLQHRQPGPNRHNLHDLERSLSFHKRLSRVYDSNCRLRPKLRRLHQQRLRNTVRRTSTPRHLKTPRKEVRLFYPSFLDSRSLRVLLHLKKPRLWLFRTRMRPRAGLRWVVRNRNARLLRRRARCIARQQRLLHMRRNPLGLSQYNPKMRKLRLMCITRLHPSPKPKNNHSKSTTP